MSSHTAMSFKHWLMDSVDAENHEAGHIVAMAHRAPDWFHYAEVTYNRDKKGFEGSVVPRTDVEVPDRSSVLFIAVMGCLAEAKRSGSDEIDANCLAQVASDTHEFLRQGEAGIRVEVKLATGRPRLPTVTRADFQFAENPTEKEILEALQQGREVLEVRAYWGQVEAIAGILGREPHRLEKLPSWCVP